MARYIFVTGGVSSSLGKGIAASALGALLQARGFKVKLRKLDPYLNIDPGTMNPYQHGEVFVTDDGTEADLDLGHYERFTGNNAQSTDYTTTGKIYSSVLAKERQGEYLGATVQVIPHITDEIKKFITGHTQNCDFVICEIGGTVGDIEGLPYLEAIRQLRNDLGRANTLFVHLTLLPYIAGSGELKTKPTQHSVKELLGVGIQADFLLCRADREIPEEARKKLALFCNVREDHVITALDVDDIHKVPLCYHEQKLDELVCLYFGINPQHYKPHLQQWQQLADSIDNPREQVRIAIVGKYVKLADAYKSLVQALHHASLAHKLHVNIVWVDCESDDLETILETVDGIIVPGGFGIRGTEGKMRAIRFAREQQVPFLGICLGMQLVVIEAARNLLGLSDASSSEFGETAHPVIGLMTEWEDDGKTQIRKGDDPKGGTMRLGGYPCHITQGTLAYKIYGRDVIIERHRHRYEVNPNYQESLEKTGLTFSGFSPDKCLTEIVERPDHPWFVAVQFHPEFMSLPFKPHPLFNAFVQASLDKHRK